MLRLKLPTDPRWANIAEDNLEEILIDHAFCEQKAASTAISFLVTYPELSELVTEMAALAREEMSHFEMVHKIILERGFVLGRERKDEYVGEISSFFPKTGDRTEARSCERFKVLSEYLKDQELAKFYSRLMVSEANHYSLFIRLARTYGDREEVDQKWESLLNFEGEVMARFGKKEHIHG